MNGASLSIWCSCRTARPAGSKFFHGENYRSLILLATRQKIPPPAGRSNSQQHCSGNNSWKCNQYGHHCSSSSSCFSLGVKHQILVLLSTPETFHSFSPHSSPFGITFNGIIPLPPPWIRTVEKINYSLNESKGALESGSHADWKLATANFLLKLV